MPLVKNLSKENVIPIIDFEDMTQATLNYLVVHVYNCIPTVSVSPEVSMLLPLELSQPVEYISLSDTK
jgi:hypothetical protein